MKDSKRSISNKLSLIEQQHDPQQNPNFSTTSPSCLVNLSRLNTIDDSGDKIFQGERSIKEGVGFDRKRLELQIKERQNEGKYGIKEEEMNIFRQLPEAKELLKTIPLEHRKKVRHIIKMYEDQRKEYEIEIRRLGKVLSQEERMRSSRGAVTDVTNQKQECEVTLTPTSLCFSDTTFQNICITMGCQQAIRKNQWVQFMNEGFDHTRFKHEQEMQALRQQISAKERDIRKKQHKIEQLSTILSMFQLKLKGYEQNLKSVNQQNQGLHKKIQQVQKSVRQKRDDSRPAISITVTKPDQPSPQPQSLCVYKDLTAQNRRSTSPPDRSPTYTNRQPKISLRDELIKSNNVQSEKKKEEQHHHSECDSSQFGKEKVIEKRKLRKLFSNLLAASETHEKKEILEKLSVEIGLKTKDINSLFKSM